MGVPAPGVVMDAAIRRRKTAHREEFLKTGLEQVTEWFEEFESSRSAS